MASENVRQTQWGRLVTVDEAVAATAAVVRVCGPVGSGKTEVLVRKVAAWVADGMDPQQILCVVNTAAAAHRLRVRLEAYGREAASVRIATPLQVCSDVVAQAQRVTGRGARVLSTAEYNMVLEDLKAACGDAAVLRGALQEAQSTWAQGSLTVEGTSADREAVLAGLRERLDFMGAVLREEVPALAVIALQQDPTIGRVAAVLVDDAQNLSAATLQACRLLVQQSFLACGNPNQAIVGFDPGANSTAFAALTEGGEYLQLGAGVQPAAIAAFCDALCSRDGMDAQVRTDVVSAEAPAATTLACVKWHEPQDEFRGVAQIARQAIVGKRSLEPGDIFVLVPNRVWAEGVQQAINARNLSCTVATGANPVMGDPRSAAKMGTLEAYCRLALAADPADIPAWRLWFGLGQSTCACADWEAFRVWAQARQLDAAAALQALAQSDGEPFSGAEELRNRYAQGLEAAVLAGHRGFALVKDLSALPGGKALVDAVLPIEGDESVADLHSRLLAESLSPSFAFDTQRVTIGTYAQIQGLSPKMVIAAGLLDGYVPAVPQQALQDAQPAALARLDADRRLFYSAVGKARCQVVLSSVQRADAALAQKLRMDVRRVKNEHGRQVAVVARSCFVDEAGNAAPGTVSGEQFLADE